MAGRVVRLEHGIKDALEEANLIGRVASGELGDGVGSRVDESVNARSFRLMGGATDFEVEGGNGVVSGSDVGGEVCFRDVFGEGFAAFYNKREIIFSSAYVESSCESCPLDGERLTVRGEDSRKDRLCLIVSHGRSSNESLQKGPVGIVIGGVLASISRHA